MEGGVLSPCGHEILSRSPRPQGLLTNATHKRVASSFSSHFFTQTTAVQGAALYDHHVSVVCLRTP